jgi:hypothetical protein
MILFAAANISDNESRVKFATYLAAGIVNEWYETNTNNNDKLNRVSVQSKCH